jgi:hypothetical protein
MSVVLPNVVTPIVVAPGQGVENALSSVAKKKFVHFK